MKSLGSIRKMYTTVYCCYSGGSGSHSDLLGVAGSVSLISWRTMLHEVWEKVRWSNISYSAVVNLKEAKWDKA